MTRYLGIDYGTKRIGLAGGGVGSAVRTGPSKETCKFMTRYLGIDYGTKRIGLAVSDLETKIASPLTTIDAVGSVSHQVGAVAAVAHEYTVEAFVVGLPLNMDGSEGKQAKTTRAFGEALARATDLPVHYYDERLSSVAAEELLAPAELTRKKRKGRLDPVAAQVILQGFLDQQPDQQNTDECDSA